MIFSAATASRRSSAIGARSAISWTMRCSASASSASIFLSSSTAWRSPSQSRFIRQRIASRIACSARPPIWLTIARSWFSSSSKALSVWECPVAIWISSAVAAGNVVPRPLDSGIGEDLRRVVELDEVAEVEEGGLLRDPRRLLHVVGDDDDGEAIAHLVEQLLDLGCRDRVERRGRLVEQDDVGLHRDGARDAQPLLLPAGKRQRAGIELVLHLVPESRLVERILDPVVELGLGQPLVIGKRE